MVLDPENRSSNWSPIYIAHRGFRIGAVENTLTAFQKAVELNLDYIELDIHRSKDNILYVLHDSDLARTMDGSGTIEEKFSEELDRILTHNQGDVLPRLSTVFETILTPENETTKLMIELKGEGTAELVCELIEETRNVEDKIIISSRNLDVLATAHHFMPHIPICLNITNCEEFTLQNLCEITKKEELPLPFHMVSLRATRPFSMISLKLETTDIPEKKFIHACHQWGIRALSWNYFAHSLPAFLRITELIDLGMDGFLFDDPKTVIAIRDYHQEKLVFFQASI
jgi:glycerophosphoryl diester phosphodiesterase